MMLERFRKAIRKGCDDAGTASMVSYVIGASVFILSSTFLVNFLISPPGATTSNLDYLDLKSRSASTMDVILGTGGFPARWSDTQATTDGIQRLGLIEEGTTIRVNASKFDAVARGSYLTQSSQNGVVDYAEAKTALGLTGYDFHLRAYPVFDLNDSGYGVVGMTEFDVAYVGDFSGSTWSAAAKSEAYVLEQLDVAFTNNTRSSLLGGDVFEDDKAKLKQYLVPLIGNKLDQTVIAQGAGTKYDFVRTNASALTAHLATQVSPAPSKALALSTNGNDVGYTKSRELRVIAAIANLSGLGEANVTWNDWVDTDRGTGARDDGDYGWLEVSTDNGATWCTLSTSRDGTLDPQTPATAYRARSAVINNANCAGSAGNPNVLVAFHWIADNDNNIGHGWFIDDLVVWAGAPVALVGTELTRKTFESPEYDLIVFGSNIDQNELAAEEVKGAIRDYVNTYGGRIAVMGGAANANINWLQPLFNVGTRGASPGVSIPDLTHPLLTTPNDLDPDGYTTTGEWSIPSSDEGLFTKVIGSTGHVLSVSTRGAFGASDSEGAVILTTYRPYTMTNKEDWRFIANTIMYGKYHHLYLDMGPKIPTDQPVATAVRSATMDIALGAQTNYSEIAFVLYLWQGHSTATTVEAAALTPTPPRGVIAETKGGAVWVNFTWPAANGTTWVTEYDVWRGNSPSTVTTLVKTIAANASWTFKDEHTNVTNGTTYYYNVTARNQAGRSIGSTVASATPSGFADAPTMGSVTGGLGEMSVTWSAPAATGGSAITGYRLWHSTQAGTFTDYVDVGASTTYLHTGLGTQDTRYYKVQALNAAGFGQNSTVGSGTTLALAGPPQTVAVTNATSGPGNLTLTWTAPVSLGTGALTGYKIWVSENGGASYSLLVQLNSPTNVSFQHNGLGVNATRHYVVQAVTTISEGANSSAVHNRTMAAPNTPMAFTATPNLITHMMTLNWVAPTSDAPIVRYDIHRGGSAGTETFLTSVYAPSLAHVDDSGAGTFHYKIYAVSAAGTSHAASASATT